MEVAGNGNDLAASTSACRLRVTVMVLESCLDLFVRVLPIHLKKKKGGGDGGNIQEADVVVPSALSLYTPAKKRHIPMSPSYVSVCCGKSFILRQFQHEVTCQWLRCPSPGRDLFCTNP